MSAFNMQVYEGFKDFNVECDCGVTFLASKAFKQKSVSTVDIYYIECPACNTKTISMCHNEEIRGLYDDIALLKESIEIKLKRIKKVESNLKKQKWKL